MYYVVSTPNRGKTSVSPEFTEKSTTNVTFVSYLKTILITRHIGGYNYELVGGVAQW